MKPFTSVAGAHKYAENSSRKHEAHRYVVYNGAFWFVQADDVVQDEESIEAHYYNGEKVETQAND